MRTQGTDVTDMKRKYREVKAGEFEDSLDIALVKETDLRYGENPNQPAAVYQLLGPSLPMFTNIRLAKTGKGGLSATNYMDVTRALDILKFFRNSSVAVMKHLIPCGFATNNNSDDLADVYVKARDTDARSAFGSVVVFNCPVDRSTAEALTSTYVEGVAAPDFQEGVLGILEKKKDLRAILYSNLDKLPKFTGDETHGLLDMKILPTGRVIVQQPYLSSIKSAEDLVLDPMVKYQDQGIEKSVFVERKPSQEELEDLLTAWYINLGVRSNGIVLVKDGTSLAIGSGQQERVGAVEQALTKAYQKSMDQEGIKYDPFDWFKSVPWSRNPLQGAVCSSDGFFPKRDSIDRLSRFGVSAIIQPGGSIKDYEVIQAANEHKMAMAFTLERCFGHF